MVFMFVLYKIKSGMFTQSLLRDWYIFILPLKVDIFILPLSCVDSFFNYVAFGPLLLACYVSLSVTCKRDHSVFAPFLLTDLTRHDRSIHVFSNCTILALEQSTRRPLELLMDPTTFLALIHPFTSVHNVTIALLQCNMFITALFTIARIWKWPSGQKQMNGYPATSWSFTLVGLLLFLYLGSGYFLSIDFLWSFTY